MLKLIDKKIITNLSNNIYLNLCILKQKSYVRLTFMFASAKYINAFHLNFHITNCDYLKTFFTEEKFIW